MLGLSSRQVEKKRNKTLASGSRRLPTRYISIELARPAFQDLLKYFHAIAGTELRPGLHPDVWTEHQLHVHFHFLVTEEGEDL